MTLSRISVPTAALSSLPYSSSHEVEFFPMAICPGGIKHDYLSPGPSNLRESMQGAIDGRDFLVNCPIDLYAQVAVFPDDGDVLSVRDSGNHTKIIEAIALLDVSFKIQQWATDREKTEKTGGKELVVSSCIPRGKGMASSSAELAAALSAVCEIHGLDVSPVKMSKLMELVEPSDSVHLPGIAHVNQLNGAVHACLSAPDDMSVVVVDCVVEAFSRVFGNDVQIMGDHRIVSGGCHAY